MFTCPHITIYTTGMDVRLLTYGWWSWWEAEVHGLDYIMEARTASSRSCGEQGSTCYWKDDIFLIIMTFLVELIKSLVYTIQQSCGNNSLYYFYNRALSRSRLLGVAKCLYVRNAMCMRDVPLCWVRKEITLSSRRTVTNSGASTLPPYQYFTF
jgi:hypothetical protein